MLRGRATVAVAIPLVAVLLSACVSQDEYDKVVAENQQLQAENTTLTQENAALQNEQAKMRDAYRWVQTGDLLFPAGGWQLGEDGKKALDELVPRLRNLADSKVVVYGYTDNTPVGAGMQSQGIENNMDLSLRRAGVVANYLVEQGVDPDIVSAKGRGETHPAASNDTEEGRAQNRRIEVVVTGTGM
jgi:chemotaxis protein MotB